MTKVDAMLVASAISRTAVSAGIMCDIQDNLQKKFPDFEWYINPDGCSEIRVRDWEQ